jgi:penicillin-insensitive murein endopeptidase
MASNMRSVRIPVAPLLILAIIQTASGIAGSNAEAASPVAKEVFGRQNSPAPLAARAIGSYARGCIAGAKPLPINGPAWQAMRLSRNRNWGHPALIRYLERLALQAQQNDGWHGLLVGDLAQPMGGPMLTGHASHQIGLDADIWLTPMPRRTMDRNERETRSAISMLADDGVSTDPSLWTSEHARLIRRAASYPEVARIFVHPAIKQTLCKWAGQDRGWLSKVRPWWGHHYHFHVRLACPPGSPGCVDQAAVGPEDGCGREVESWLSRMRKPAVEPPQPKKPAKPRKPKPPMTLDQLPDACAALVADDLVAIPPVPTQAVPMPERKAGEPDRQSSMTRFIKKVMGE